MPPTEEGYSGGVGGSGGSTNANATTNNNSMNGLGGHVGGSNLQQPPSQQKSNIIMFDTTKNELYRTSDTYKTLQVSD